MKEHGELKSELLSGPYRQGFLGVKESVAADFSLGVPSCFPQSSGKERPSDLPEKCKN